MVELFAKMYSSPKANCIQGELALSPYTLTLDLQNTQKNKQGRMNSEIYFMHRPKAPSMGNPNKLYLLPL